jgi:hypothetical protein
VGTSSKRVDWLDGQIVEEKDTAFKSGWRHGRVRGLVYGLTSGWFIAGLLWSMRACS